MRVICIIYRYDMYTICLWGQRSKRKEERDVLEQVLCYIQPIAFGVSFNLMLQSQSDWSLFNGTQQKNRRELNY